VVDGKVSVSAGGAAAELGAGEMSRSPGGAPPSTSKVEDAFALLDWMGSTLVFQRTPLNRAIREIERRYGVAVVLEDPKLGELAVTATFTDQVLEEVVLVLCEIIGGRCSVEQDRVRISKGPPLGAEMRIGGQSMRLPRSVPVT
jgi:ferric-dicitrate binding protein FerR (iron transport regulator)